MAKKNDITSVALVAAILVAAYLYLINKQQKEVIKKLESDKDDIKKLFDVVKHTDQFSEGMQQSLETLINKYQKLDPNVAAEISKALSLFQLGQQENAIKSLVKIMEDLLNKKLSTDTGFIAWLKTKKKQMTLHNMLEYANEHSLIEEEEHKFFVAAKSIRNRESHEVGFKAAAVITAAGLLAALYGIVKLSEMVYPNFLKGDKD